MYVRLLAGLPCSGKTFYCSEWVRYDRGVLFDNPDLTKDVDKIKLAIKERKNICVTHDDFCNPIIMGAALNWFKKETNPQHHSVECYHIRPNINMHRKVFEYRKNVKKENVNEQRFNELFEKYNSLYVPLNVSHGIDCFHLK